MSMQITSAGLGALLAPPPLLLVLPALGGRCCRTSSRTTSSDADEVPALARGQPACRAGSSCTGTGA
jgi:hypothetical protein